MTQRFALLSILLALPLVGCDDDDGNGVPDSAQFGDLDATQGKAFCEEFSNVDDRVSVTGEAECVESWLDDGGGASCDEYVTACAAGFDDDDDSGSDDASACDDAETVDAVLDAVGQACPELTVGQVRDCFDSLAKLANKYEAAFTCENAEGGSVEFDDSDAGTACEEVQCFLEIVGGGEDEISGDDDEF